MSWRNLKGVTNIIGYKTYVLDFKGLVTNYGEGGATKWEGGAREVLPLRKGGAEKVLAMLKGGYKKCWGSFYAVA